MRHATRLVFHFLLQVNGDARVISGGPVADTGEPRQAMWLRVGACGSDVLLLGRSVGSIVIGWGLGRIFGFNFSGAQVSGLGRASPLWRLGLERALCRGRVIDFSNRLARFLRAR